VKDDEMGAGERLARVASSSIALGPHAPSVRVIAPLKVRIGLHSRLGLSEPACRAPPVNSVETILSSLHEPIQRVNGLRSSSIHCSGIHRPDSEAA
jgi:hypothetical protein